jgi:hypothetical protein
MHAAADTVYILLHAMLLLNYYTVTNTQRLDHPSVARLQEVYHSPDYVFMVMDIYEGMIASFTHIQLYTHAVIYTCKTCCSSL